VTNRLVVGLTLAGLLSGGFLLAEKLGIAGTPRNGMVVEEVNANLMRVRLNGVWEELPLMPLSDHLCRSNNRLFERYCGEAEDDDE
jgi:hypothetical protein